MESARSLCMTNPCFLDCEVTKSLLPPRSTNLSLSFTLRILRAIVCQMGCTLPDSFPEFKDVLAERLKGYVNRKNSLKVIQRRI